MTVLDAKGEPLATVKRWETGDVGNPHIVFEVDDPFDVVLADATAAVRNADVTAASVLVEAEMTTVMCRYISVAAQARWLDEETGDK